MLAVGSVRIEVIDHERDGFVAHAKDLNPFPAIPEGVIPLWHP